MHIQVHNVDYHRNGIMGKGFHVVTFDWQNSHSRSKKPQRMAGIVFNVSHDPDVIRTAILDVDQLAAGDIAFGSNSWRGDQFHSALVDAIFDDQYAKYQFCEADTKEESLRETEKRIALDKREPTTSLDP